MTSEGRLTAVTPPNSKLLNEMVIDGIASTDTNYIIFGRDPESGDIIAWTSNDTEQWDEETVSVDFSEGSHIRTITTKANTRVALGIASDTLHTIIWTSTNGQNWQHTATSKPNQPASTAAHKPALFRFENCSGGLLNPA